MDIFWESLLDALKDTAIVVPFLYLAYLLVGYFSHSGNKKFVSFMQKSRYGGPAVGAFLGCIPQCGFSSMIAQLYTKDLVTIGTLFAVFLATSDEAIPLMISQPEFIPKLLLLLAVKVVYAFVIGYLVDFVVNIFNRRKIKKAQERAAAAENGAIEDAQHCDCGNVHHHNHSHEEENHKCCAKNIFLDALWHTLTITAYVFVATLALNLLIGYCGLDFVQSIFTTNAYVQVLIACVVGLIPNCAASVFLVEMYMSGALGFAALAAGLCAGAGVGLIVLFSAGKKKVARSLAILVALYGFAVLCGILLNLIGIA